MDTEDESSLARALDELGLKYVGMTGGLSLQPSVDELGAVTLQNWQAMLTPEGSLHLIGYCIELFEGRASTAVTGVDAARRAVLTASGRTYKLQGKPGRDSDAAWVWQTFKRVNQLSSETDVSAQVFALFEQASK